MTPQTRQLLDEIRGMIPGGEIRERAMFGTIALMVDDVLLVAVNADGSLLVRVEASEDTALRQEPDAHRAVMGARERTMGIGWLRVDTSTSPERLAFWIEAALRRQRTATPAKNLRS